MTVDWDGTWPLLECYIRVIIDTGKGISIYGVIYINSWNDISLRIHNGVSDPHSYTYGTASYFELGHVVE